MCHLPAGTSAVPHRPHTSGKRSTRVNTQASAQRQLTLAEWIHWKSFGNVAEFKYFRMTVTNQNHIHRKLNRRLDLKNPCYQSVQGLCYSILSSQILRLKYTYIANELLFYIGMKIYLPILILSQFNPFLT